MATVAELHAEFPRATAGDIAVLNHESSRRRSWGKFWNYPERPGIAEFIVEQEQLSLQFLADTAALERLESLSRRLAATAESYSRHSLVHAQVAATLHRFSEARAYLAQARDSEAAGLSIERLSLSIDQACGMNLERVLKARYRLSSGGEKLGDLVALGGLLADLGEIDQADRIYQRAIDCYQDVSPFALAWACFQLGVLWGEVAPEPHPARAAQWYQRAIGYLPSYVKAHVHLAEIYCEEQRYEEAQALLLKVISSGDPEVHWRLADVLDDMNRPEAAQVQMQLAHVGFESLLDKYPLAFADHGAEFYAGSGANAERAFELASLNLNNRRTKRALTQTWSTALATGRNDVASALALELHSPVSEQISRLLNCDALPAALCKDTGNFTYAQT
jgi:tetratricopeptide (TPR) repeat protein